MTLLHFSKRCQMGSIEHLMLDIMYELPSSHDIRRHLITKEMVEKRLKKELLVHPAAFSHQKSA